MATRAYDRRCLALAQLETALRLYFEADDFASVVTLAGAADEIFGKLLAARGCDSSLETIKKAAAEIHVKLFGSTLAPSTIGERANFARNSLKHFAAGQSLTIDVDLPQEARDMVNRAIDNYWSLEKSLTAAMERFQREIRGP